MLRALVLALALANAAFFAWTQGALDAVVGVRASGDREPERLARQVRPESIRIVTAPAASAASAALTPLLCLESGPFATTEISAAENALRAVMPAAGSASWSSVKTEVPGAWIVYMGRYLNPELLARKQEELRRRKVSFEPVTGAAALEPGLSLGRFDVRRAADEALEEFALLGIRTAKVVEIVPPSSTHRLRIERADAALAARLGAIQTGALRGKPFAPCAAAPAAV